MALREEVCEKARKHKKLLIGITIVFAAALALVLIALFLRYLRYLVFTYPVNQVSQYGITNTTEKANLINQYRTTSIQFIATLAQIIGGFVLLLGLYFTWENLITAREGQITERFTRAVDQLGNDKLEVRLGGIYSLERIANKSDKDYWPIMEILTAYVRENSPNIGIENIDAHGILNPKKTSLDIQAILTVIRRRKNSFNDGESNSLNLSSSYLGWTDLRGVNLAGANLEGANFYGSGLQGANFEKASLEEVIFEDANLKGTNFQGAKLGSAEFKKASLIEAIFIKAVLTGAYFTEADLQGADLKGANLEGADLRRAKNLTVEQLSKAETLYNAKLDEEL